MSSPYITIVTPNLNGERYLEQTILSVKNQSYSKIEHIIIDGMSEDSSLEIIKKYEDSLSWSSEKDHGISDAFNKGIERANGELIGIINSDDWLEPNAIQILVDTWQKSPDFDVYYGKTKLIKKEKGKSWFYPTNALAHIFLTVSMSIAHPSVFIKKSAYIQYGTFNDQYKLAMDYDLLLRFFLMGCKFKFIDHHLVNFRMEGLSSSLYEKSLVECSVIRDKIMLDMMN